MRQLVTFGFLFLFISFNAHASKWAIVKSTRAVIYSDMKLESAIGYVRNGTRIKVGEVPRKRGTILPVVVSGRIGYIQIKDIAIFDNDNQLIDGPQITEHTVEGTFKEEDEDDISQNNHVLVQGGIMAVGDDWNKLAELVGDEQNVSAKYLSILFEHRAPFKNFSYAFGASFYSLEQAQLQMKTLSLDGLIFWRPIYNNIFSVDLYGGFTGSADFRVILKGVSGEFKGSYLGYKFGGQFSLFPKSRLGFMAGVGFTQFNMSGLNEIQIPNTEGNVLGTLTTFGGVNLYGGMSYRF